MRLPLNRRHKCFLYLSLFLLVFGSTLLIVFNPLLEFIVDKSMVVAPGNKAFREWRKTRPLPMNVYFFNWTNPEDVYTPGVKAKFEEVGPYSFFHVREKVNVTFNDNNKTVTYQHFLSYVDDENSKGNLSDVITTVDMVAWSMANLANNSSSIFKGSAKLALYFSDIYVKKTVGELLFKGYDHPLLTLGHGFSFLTGEDTPDKFGYFYSMNNSIGFDGVYNVNLDLTKKFGVLENWNYNNSMSYYEDECAEVRGSAGEFYPKNLRPDRLQYFCTDMCRAMDFTFEKNTSVEGVPSFKYSMGERILDNGSKIEENRCYCKERCLPSGVIDMSKCRKGLPVYSSLPHFYNADPWYTSSIEGMKPDKDKHEFYFSLEPSLGIITETAARVQFNIYMQSLPDFRLFDGVNEFMYPVFWTEHRVVLYDEYLSGIKMLLSMPKINLIFSLCCLIAGLLLIMYLVLIIALSPTKTAKHKLPQDEVPLK